MSTDVTVGGPGSALDLSRTVVHGWSVPGYLNRVTVLVMTGLTWSARSAQEVLFHPDYWNPSTVADFFAVYAFSAAWLLTAASLLILREVAPPIPKLSTGILVVASACVLAGVANGFEDGLGAKGLGVVYVIGAMVGALGMVIIGGLLWISRSRRLSFVPLASGVTMVMLTTVVGALGLVPWLSLAIFIILARTAPSEDGNGAQSPPGSQQPLTRILGLTGVLGGVALVAAFVPNLPWSADAFNLRLVVFSAGAIAVVIAVYRRPPSLWRASSVGVAVAVAPVLAHSLYLVMIVISIGRPQPPEADPEFRLVLFVAGAAMWLADAAFGLVALRRRVVARWSAAALAVGSLLAFSGMDRLELVRGDFAWLFEPAALAGIALAGAGWILLGLELAMSPRPLGVRPGQ